LAEHNLYWLRFLRFVLGFFFPLFSYYFLSAFQATHEAAAAATTSTAAIGTQSPEPGVSSCTGACVVGESVAAAAGAVT